MKRSRNVHLISIVTHQALLLFQEPQTLHLYLQVWIGPSPKYFIACVSAKMLSPGFSCRIFIHGEAYRNALISSHELTPQASIFAFSHGCNHVLSSVEKTVNSPTSSIHTMKWGKFCACLNWLRFSRSMEGKHVGPIGKLCCHCKKTPIPKAKRPNLVSSFRHPCMNCIRSRWYITDAIVSIRSSLATWPPTTAAALICDEKLRKILQACFSSKSNEFRNSQPVCIEPGSSSSMMCGNRSRGYGHCVSVNELGISNGTVPSFIDKPISVL